MQFAQALKDVRGGFAQPHLLQRVDVDFWQETGCGQRPALHVVEAREDRLVEVGADPFARSRIAG